MNGIEGDEEVDVYWKPFQSSREGLSNALESTDDTGTEN